MTENDLHQNKKSPDQQTLLTNPGSGNGKQKFFLSPALRPKLYTYLTDDGCYDRRAKATKKCVIKREIKFKDHKNC